MNILLCVTGSVAAIKTYQLAEALEKLGDVKIAVTKCGLYFIEQSKNGFAKWGIIDDKAEWPESYKLGDPIQHIELRNWADCLVVAPLDANTLAKFANGICDNLVTSVFRAWNREKPIFLVPAMNTQMWENEPTETQINLLKEWGCKIISPVSKRLACNDVGMGAMAPIDVIFNTVNSLINRWEYPLPPKKSLANLSYYLSSPTRYIPEGDHPGAFEYHRKKFYHTGVDLYCEDNSVVNAVEDGIIVAIKPFTGIAYNHPNWEDTDCIMVEGKTGVVNYGEVTVLPELKIGDKVQKKQHIANVKRVLPFDRLRSDIPHHSTSMLHLELYTHGTTDCVDWSDTDERPANLLDPTIYLQNSQII